MPEQADDGIVLTNLQGVILDANPRACQMFGYTREELLYSNASRLLYPDGVRFSPFTLEGLGFPSTLAYERRMRRKDGTFIEVEGRRRSLQGSKSILILRDIAQRKHAEAQAKEWEDRFDAAVAASGKVLYELDLKTKEMVWVGAATSSVGAAFEALPGRHARWLSLVHPDDQRAVKAAIERVHLGRGRLHTEYRVKRKDGGYMRVRDEGCFHGGVRSPRVVGFIEDITETKLAAEELQRSHEAHQVAAQLAGVIVWDWDLSTGRIRCSEDAEAILGFKKGELRETRDAVIWAIHSADRARALEASARAASGVEPDLMIRLVRRDGSVVTVRCTGRAFRDSAGHPVRMVGMLMIVPTT